MIAIKTIYSLLRVNQWYKNLIVFVPLVFSRSFLNPAAVLASFAGFAVLCLVSSSNYILNDVTDRKRDRLNPEKKERPIASGKVGLPAAFTTAVIFLFTGFFVSWGFSPYFFLVVALFFLVSTLYSFLLKKMIFADIIAISFNFLLRAISGAVLINVYISPWLVMGILFFALFLALGKRYGEVSYLKKKSSGHRSVLRFYTRDMINSLLIMVMGILVLTFGLYSFSSDYPNLIWELPLFLYLVLRYYHLIITDSRAVRHPERVFRDRPLLAASVIFAILTMLLILW
ncbi:MAG: UbiA prenyltransferase family protein [archaeon]|nr:MAG: UbiA prenyltransferase family protein [archaeon]